MSSCHTPMRISVSTGLQSCRLAVGYTGPKRPCWGHCHRCVSVPAMSRALQKEQARHAATQQDALQTGAFLESLFGSICAGTPAVSDAQAWLHACEAQSIGQYAAWFGANPNQALLQAALQHLMRCTALGPAATAAGTAFRNLCQCCGPQLGTQPVLASLLGAVRAALAHPGTYATALPCSSLCVLKHPCAGLSGICFQEILRE